VPVVDQRPIGRTGGEIAVVVLGGDGARMPLPPKLMSNPTAVWATMNPVRGRPSSVTRRSPKVKTLSVGDKALEQGEQFLLF